jgi:hypothetical protein
MNDSGETRERERERESKKHKNGDGKWDTPISY